MLTIYTQPANALNANCPTHRKVTYRQSTRMTQCKDCKWYLSLSETLCERGTRKVTTIAIKAGPQPEVWEEGLSSPPPLKSRRRLMFFTKK